MRTTRYTRKQHDVLELITHLILTKPNAVVGLLNRYGVRFSFRPQSDDLIHELVELLKEKNDRFYTDLNRLISIHIQHKGMEIMALELGQEDNFLGNILGGVVKPLIGGLFGGGRSGSNNNAAQAQAQAQAQADRMKAEMAAKMQQMEADRRRQAEEDRRRRQQEEEDRRRRQQQQEDERRRRQQQEADQRRRQQEADNGNGRRGNNNMMIFGGIGLVLLIGVGVFVSSKKAA